MEKKVHKIPVSKIHTGGNDRTIFKQADIESLAASIKEHNLIQPITVNSDYQLIAGERRFRAVQFLGWKTIDGFIVDLTQEEAAALALQYTIN
jgi:ParB family chromosome partitioning protein